MEEEILTLSPKRNEDTLSHTKTKSSLSGFEVWFWEHVADYIDSPQTWFIFGQTCRFFSDIARDWSSIRKNEYRVSVHEWMAKFTTQEPRYIHISMPCEFDVPLVLPDGRLHGVMRSGVDGNTDDRMSSLITIDTGLVKVIQDVENGWHYPVVNVPWKMFFWGHIFVFVCSDVYNGLYNGLCRQIRYTRFGDLSRDWFITGEECGFCHKVHDFFSNYSRDYPVAEYRRNCLETEYRFLRNSVRDINRRAVRIRGILQLVREMSTEEFDQLIAACGQTPNNP